MLTQLSIRNVILIEKLDLDFFGGLAVFTGETGAGKSILLDSLGLALGERSRSGLVRPGATQATISATFDLPGTHPVIALLHAHGLALELSEEPFILRRVITPDGKSRAFISDRAVSSALIRQVGRLLVEIQGQHAQMTLADTATHRDLLDAFAVDPSLLSATAETHQILAHAQSALAAEETALLKAQEDEVFLRQSVDDLAKLSPKDQEEDDLVAQRAALQREERQTEAVNAALAELNPRDRRNSGPAAALRSVARLLSRVVAPEPATGDLTSPRLAQGQEVLVALEKAEEAVAEVDLLLSRLAQESDVDSAHLESTEERLFALRAAARKHHVSVAELPDLYLSFRARLDSLDLGQSELSHLRQAVTAARTQYDAAAGRLSAARLVAAEQLKAAIEAEFIPLKLARANLDVALTTLSPPEWGALGKERVTFLIATNPGQDPGPLGKIASGGELSRIMLALKVVLSAGSDVTTLVFDEVDAGVGGATAAAIGERLKAIARTTQVFAVTHSPQIAAHAAQHMRISKTVAAGQTGTQAHLLDPEARREELARMLAGEKVTDAARGAADSLLGNAE